MEIANGTACAALGYAEDELLGRDWFATAVAEHERDAAREAFARLLAGDGTVGLPRHARRATGAGRSRATPTGAPIGALGWGEPARSNAAGGGKRSYPEHHAPPRAAASLAAALLAGLRLG